jgi:DNA polymerase-3 subunit epsilon
VGQRLAVIDVETTGFRKTDRVVEIAIVLMDGSSLTIVDEYETLVNPLRDISASHIHGITAGMVESAPTFDDLAPYLGTLLDGAILAAHNLPFDTRFLRQEYDRTPISFDTGSGLDTLQLTGEKLSAACARYGITNSGEHWALGDARATAELIRILEPDLDAAPAHAQVPNCGMPRTLPRQHDQRGSTAHHSTRLPATAPAELAYLDTLDRFLADGVLDDDEREALADLRDAYGIASAAQTALHLDYLGAVIAAAQRDNIITKTEHAHIHALATTLGIHTDVVPEITETHTPTTLDGMRVCFTGSANIGGQAIERRDLEAIAAVRGLQPVASVTKKGCDLVVAADPASTSGKAKKARDYGIAVISVADFLTQTNSQ